MTGWKIGFAYGHEKLMQPLRNLHQFTVFCSAQPLQWGMVAAFEQLDRSYFENFRKDYSKRRDLLCEILRAAGFELAVPEGSYFICAHYGQLSDETDLQFANTLVEKHGVSTIPISPFFLDSERASHRQILRFGFCKSEQIIQAAGERLMKIRG